MGIIKSINDWEVSVGENVGNYIQDTLTGTARLLCNVRAKYPNSFFDRSFGKGLSNSICSTLDIPPAVEEPPPFTGGQCEGVLYTVNVELYRRFNQGAEQYDPRSIIQIPGRVLDVVLRQRPSDTRISEIAIFSSSNGGVEPVRTDTIGGVGISYREEGISVVREDGLVDDCGSLPPSFPPDPTRDPNDFKTSIQVCDRDENGNEVGCTDVIVELPIDEEKYDFPICIMVDGKKICLDADGWSVEDSTEEEVPEEEEEEEEFEEIEVLDYVLVSVNQLPTKFNKRITRTDAKDSEIFAGYLAWAYVEEGGQFFYPAIPIRKEKNAFKAPEGIESYSVYMNFELTASVTEIKKTVKVPIVPPEDGGTMP